MPVFPKFVQVPSRRRRGPAGNLAFRRGRHGRRRGPSRGASGPQWGRGDAQSLGHGVTRTLRLRVRRDDYWHAISKNSSSIKIMLPQALFVSIQTMSMTSMPLSSNFVSKFPFFMPASLTGQRVIPSRKSLFPALSMSDVTSDGTTSSPLDKYKLVQIFKVYLLII
jgi:hypothetical protein